jgi:hypothetical protein
MDNKNGLSWSMPNASSSNLPPYRSGARLRLKGNISKPVFRLIGARVETTMETGRLSAMGQGESTCVPPLPYTLSPPVPLAAVKSPPCSMNPWMMRWKHDPGT